MQEILSGEAHGEVRAERGWKLFVLLPRMLCGIQSEDRVVCAAQSGLGKLHIMKNGCGHGACRGMSLQASGVVAVGPKIVEADQLGSVVSR